MSEKMTFDRTSTENRLGMMRYGMLVIVLLAFGITAAYSIYANVGAIVPSIVSGLIASVVTGVAMAGVYFGYATYLKRSA